MADDLDIDALLEAPYVKHEVKGTLILVLSRHVIFKYLLNTVVSIFIDKFKIMKQLSSDHKKLTKEETPGRKIN